MALSLTLQMGQNLHKIGSTQKALDSKMVVMAFSGLFGRQIQESGLLLSIQVEST